MFEPNTILFIITIPIVVILVLVFSGYKCLSCGARTRDTISSKWIDTTPKTKSGSRDKRYDSRGHRQYKIKCKNCKKIFTYPYF